MPSAIQSNYKLEYARYRHYFHRLWVFYQKPVTKVSSALLLTIFTIIFFAAFAIRPTLTTVAELLKKINDQAEVLVGLEKKAASLAQAQQEYLVVQPKLEAINTSLPAKVAVDAIASQIEGTASDSQLALNSLSLGNVAYVPESAPQNSGLQQHPISLSLDATYSDLKTFLERIINIPRLVSVNSINFNSENQSNDVSDQLNLSINLEAYHLPRSYPSNP